MRDPTAKEWSEAELRLLIKMVKHRAKSAEIAKKLRRHVGSIKRTARDLGLLLRK